MTERGNALFTDLYELTMAASYHRQKLDHRATFEVFVRRLPPDRNFLVACGLEQVLDYLEGWRFEPDELEYLASIGRFPDDFLERLASIRFTGEVWAIPEGTPVFPNEPLLRVAAHRGTGGGDGAVEHARVPDHGRVGKERG